MKLMLNMPDGRQYDLILTQRVVEGVTYHPIDDPDLYRVLVDTAQIALFHLEQNVLHADMVRWGWRPHWAKDRAAPINARVEKVAHGPFFRAIWPHRAIIAIDNCRA